MNKHKKDKRIAHDLLYIANIIDAGEERARPLCNNQMTSKSQLG